MTQNELFATPQRRQELREQNNDRRRAAIWRNWSDLERDDHAIAVMDDHAGMEWMAMRWRSKRCSFAAEALQDFIELDD